MLSGQLGHFEILGPLGSGGMGQVYRARDTRLGRTVAIKVLPEELSSDPERQRRLEREARAIASLTNPHICTLHDLGRVDGISFLVMELLDGETLEQRLARGPMHLRDALACATDIAEALTAAHRAGIVHRDLKPANVMLTRSGAKLLDFGIAQEALPSLVDADGQTRTSTASVAMEVAGTLPYMAPEQLEGGRADARTDVHALGLLIVEMATGQRVQRGSSKAGVIAAILHEPVPALSSMLPGVTPALDQIVAGCLAKQPDDRWSSAHDVLMLLRGLESRGADEAAPSAASRRAWIPWSLAAAASIAAIGALWLWQPSRRHVADTGSLEVLSILPAEGTTLEREAPQVSPDGRHVAFTARDRGGRTQIYLRSRDSAAPRALAGTDDAIMPFWAPDSQRLGFFAAGQLKVTAISGGTPQRLAPAPGPRGGAWRKDDVILFVPAPPLGLHRVSAAGGSVERLPAPPDQLRWFPRFLPDGRFLFLGQTMARREGAVYVGSLDSTDAVRLIESRHGALYAPSGHLLFVRDSTLMAQPFDLATMMLSGQPVAIAADVGTDPTRGLFSVSDTDVLSFMSNTPTSRLAWFDRNGRPLGDLPPQGQNTFQGLCLSRDDRFVVFETTDRGMGNADIFAMEAETGALTRLTFDESVDFYPICADAGDGIVFSSLRAGHPRLFTTRISTPGRETLLKEGPMPLLPTDWSSPDRIVVGEQHPTRQWDVALLSLPDRTLVPVAATDGDEREGKLSPDGRWLSYTSFEAAGPQVFVVPVPPTGSRWQVSDSGGQQAMWQADGKRLYYLTVDRKLTAVDVQASGGSIAFGPKETLFETRAVTGGTARQSWAYAVTRDGKRIVVNRASDALVPVTVMTNWSKALSR